MGCANGHFETKALESAHQGSLELVGVSAIEVIGPEVVIGLLMFEHVEFDYQDGMSHGDDSSRT